MIVRVDPRYYRPTEVDTLLGDATKVKFTPTSVQQRWPVLQSGQVDLLSRNTTITFSRNAWFLI